MTTAMTTLSIVIVNYNYGRYLAGSIESALDQGDHEIVVVDDGSSDDSHQVIDRFSGRVRPVFKANGGHSSAINAGFASSTGGYVLFLDADDVLLPGCAAEILNAVESDVSKVQWGLRTIDSAGKPTGHVYPRFTAEHTPQWCREQLARCSWYDAPPTSGNAWSRTFLSKVLPMPADVGSPLWAIDDYLHLLAPSFGDVISVPDVLGEYRVHQTQMSSVAAASIERVRQVCSDERLRYELVNGKLAGLLGKPSTLNPLKWSQHAQNRLVLRKSGDRGDRLPALVMAYLRAYAAADMPVRSKLVNSIFGPALALAPSRAAEWLIQRRLRSAANVFGTEG